ncbi:uncharacterized protein BT62DRAFT_1014077 [Guyanagaster necrorhizus]|uniref:Uncharacterized protein n=1 Tax=Guyanagaster necrorhizus TaxID=856835 RepID=A0A9P7VEX5_9AGAR|nr:uncharacterized protein BT62DRAFT_1014077 [Guyanagaster necrorhizus MCA 3950]KAG7439337.1 hypothetical protein BT62DRAFT_1014077 [Guyanagaster necrorhizus MCA 3950]
MSDILVYAGLLTYDVYLRIILSSTRGIGGIEATEDSLSPEEDAFYVWVPSRSQDHGLSIIPSIWLIMATHLRAEVELNSAECAGSEVHEHNAMAASKQAIKEAEEKGIDASFAAKYCTSKVLAEKG